VKIKPFAVEQWMNAHEKTAIWNTAETCVDSLRMAELLALAGDGDAVLRRLLETRLDYGHITGSPELRAAIAALYGERIGPDDLITTNGAIGANFLSLFALVEPGDSVVCVRPTYQQLFSVPEALGAQVRLLSLREEDFVLAAELSGASRFRIITRHMVPAFMSHIIATSTLAIPVMIINETSLSFLGLGIRPPAISWGVLLQEAQNIQTVAQAPWLLMPGLGVIIAVLAFNLVGDGLRDAADPYSH